MAEERHWVDAAGMEWIVRSNELHRFQVGGEFSSRPAPGLIFRRADGGEMFGAPAAVERPLDDFSEQELQEMVDNRESVVPRRSWIDSRDGEMYDVTVGRMGLGAVAHRETTVSFLRLRDGFRRSTTAPRDTHNPFIFSDEELMELLDDARRGRARGR